MKNKIIIMLFFSAFMTKTASESENPTANSTKPATESSGASTPSDGSEAPVNGDPLVVLASNFGTLKADPHLNPTVPPQSPFTTTLDALATAASYVVTAAAACTAAASYVADAVSSSSAPEISEADRQKFTIARDIRTAALSADHATLDAILKGRGPKKFYEAAAEPNSDEIRALESLCFARGEIAIPCLRLFALVEKGRLLHLPIRKNNDTILQAIISKKATKEIIQALLELKAPLESQNRHEPNVSFTINRLLRAATKTDDKQTKKYLQEVGELICAENTARYREATFNIAEEEAT